MAPNVTKVRRVSFLVPEELLERSQKIVWGGRSPVMRVLLEKFVDAFEKHGSKIVGAVIDGEFEITPTYKTKGR